MILLFGDSWARQSWRHSQQNINNGYQHWSYPDTWVVNNQDDWINQYFQKTIVINFAEFGNTNEWILRDLYHRRNTMSNLPDRVDFVVFQTDPLRIFAPRQDYNDQDIVWPAFMQWCDQNQFDWKTSTFDDLLVEIYGDWYRRLQGFISTTRRLNQDKQINLWLLGGVSRLHDCVHNYHDQIIAPSVTELFGFDRDCCLENRASFASFSGFWQRNLRDHPQRSLLLQQWNHYDLLLQAKEKFWYDHSEYFAGRHLTSQAMGFLAEHIEKTID
jgi:hypothetical protein